MKNEIQINNRNNVALRKFDKVPIDLLKLVDKINAILMLEPLSEGEVLILAKFIYSEYKDLTLDDIEDSIFKSKSGKLECNPATYKKLDIDYFGRVLTAYRQYKIENNRNIVVKDEPKIALIDYTKEQEEKMSYDFIVKVIKEESRMPFIADWVACYDYLINNNLIFISNIDKKNIVKEVHAEIKAEASRLKQSNKLVYFGFEDQLKNDKVYMKVESIKKVLYKYFINGLYRRV